MTQPENHSLIPENIKINPTTGAQLTVPLPGTDLSSSSLPIHMTDTALDKGVVLRRNGMLICLVGPSGTGKSTLARKFADNGVSRAVSVTSRQPREGEKDGENYYFVSREEFQRRAAEGRFFEWQEIHGNLYGQLKETLESAVSGGKDLLVDIDIRGALNLKKYFQGNCVVIFLVPPSFEEMEKRIRGRAPISEEELQRRFETAKAEYEKLLSCTKEGVVDYILVTHDVESSARKLQEIISAESGRLSRINVSDLTGLCQIR